MLWRITAKWQHSRYWCLSSFKPSRNEGRKSKYFDFRGGLESERVSNHNLQDHLTKVVHLWMTADFVGWLFRHTKKLTLELVASHYGFDSKEISSLKSTWKRSTIRAPQWHKRTGLTLSNVVIAVWWGFVQAGLRRLNLQHAPISVGCVSVINRLIVDQLRITNLTDSAHKAGSWWKGDTRSHGQVSWGR